MKNLFFITFFTFISFTSFANEQPETKFLVIESVDSPRHCVMTSKGAFCSEPKHLVTFVYFNKQGRQSTGTILTSKNYKKGDIISDLVLIQRS